MAATAVANRARLLLATDCLHDIESFLRLLGPIGETTVAHTESEALGWLGRNTFDVVLWDLAANSRSPRGQHELLRGGEIDWTDRVVYIAGPAASADIDELATSVPNELLRRPVVPRELLRVVAQLCRRMSVGYRSL